MSVVLTREKYIFDCLIVLPVPLRKIILLLLGWPDSYLYLKMYPKYSNVSLNKFIHVYGYLRNSLEIYVFLAIQTKKDKYIIQNISTHLTTFVPIYCKDVHISGEMFNRDDLDEKNSPQEFSDGRTYHCFTCFPDVEQSIIIKYTKKYETVKELLFEQYIRKIDKEVDFKNTY
jgi:hypothetical protein